MVSFNNAALALFLAVAGSADASSSTLRKLSQESIAGYGPRSQVTDHNAIDLDLDLIQTQLALGTTQSQQVARDVYETGAFSKSVATVTLSTPLTTAVNKGDVVLGTSAGSEQVRGKMLTDYPVGSTSIGIQYSTTDVQASYVGCQVGANPNPNVVGCFAASGSFTVNGVATLTYSYNPTSDNTNERTLQGFSTAAEAKMYQCANCPYRTYEKFVQYYGQFDYADRWVTAAFEGRETSFSNGNANFGPYTITGRTEAIKKGIAYMNVFMYVIREFEDALDDCQEGCTIENCNDDPVHAWDEGVAFYTGSLEGQDGSGSGVLLHALADKRCANFRTCGDLATEDSGLSHANIEIFRQFDEGLRLILEGKCSAARNIKNRIEDLMAIPLIQGTLRYAYIKEFENDAGEKAEAEGATFAAAVLPYVNACEPDDADIIFDNMKVGSGNRISFTDVKSAFERNYDCLGLRCEDIGGVWDSANREYLPFGEPCGSSSSKMILGFGAMVASATVSAILMLF